MLALVSSTSLGFAPAAPLAAARPAAISAKMESVEDLKSLSKKLVSPPLVEQNQKAVEGFPRHGSKA